MNKKELEYLNKKYAEIIIDNFKRIDKSDESEKHFYFEHMQFYFRKYLLEMDQKNGFSKFKKDKKLKREAIEFLRSKEENLSKIAFTLEMIKDDYFIDVKLTIPIKDYYLQIKRGNIKPLIKNLTLSNLKIFKNNNIVYELGDRAVGIPTRTNKLTP